MKIWRVDRKDMRLQEEVDHALKRIVIADMRRLGVSIFRSPCEKSVFFDSFDLAKRFSDWRPYRR